MNMNRYEWEKELIEVRAKMAEKLKGIHQHDFRILEF